MDRHLIPSAKKNAVPVLAGVLLSALAGGAVAQQPAPKPAPRPAASQPAAPATPAVAPATSSAAPAPSDVPQRTTASYADWIVQCETQAGPPPEKLCEMTQVTQLQGKNVPFSRVGLAHPVKGQPVRLVVQLPVNASFATNVRIQAGDSDPGVAAPFARCAPSGCFAEFDLKEDILKKLRAASGAGKLSFADAGGHDVVVPLSFNGFSQAFDALAKE